VRGEELVNNFQENFLSGERFVRTMIIGLRKQGKTNRTKAVMFKTESLYLCLAFDKMRQGDVS
jgi:hypothetical protein